MHVSAIPRECTQDLFTQERISHPRFQKVTPAELRSYHCSSLLKRVSGLFLGALSLGTDFLTSKTTPIHSSSITFPSVGWGIAALSLFPIRPVSTQEPAYGEFRINTNTTSDQSLPTLAALIDGGFVAAWEGWQTGDRDIYGQRYAASGALVGTEFRINTNTTSHQQFPTLAALNDGGFVVVWKSYQTGDFDIYGHRYEASGALVGVEFRVKTNMTISSVESMKTPSPRYKC